MIASELSERKTIIRVGEPAPRYIAPPAKPGYVYVVHPISCNAYKIGGTVDLPGRLKRMQRKRLCILEYSIIIFSEDYTRLESELLALYAPYRLDGDWFALSEDHLNYLQGLSK